MTTGMSESFPEFFSAAPTITLRDPLAAFLGAARDGVIEYTYADVVKLAGHSCPTVASAFLMTRAALAALYREALPERGGLRIELRNPAEEGVTGVVANVIGMLTGAAGETGFKGIGGRFDRRHLLVFGVPLQGQVRFTRLATGATVTATARLDGVAGDPRAMALLPRCLNGSATPAEEALFQSLWQDRVRRLLTEHADDAEVIVLQPGAGPQ